MGLSVRRYTIWGAALMASVLCCACGGERSARPDAGAAAGKAAQGPVVVAFVDEAPRALNADEEAVFVAAVVELTCVTLERTEGMTVTEGERLMPELVEVSAQILARHGLTPERFVPMQQAYADDEPMRQRVRKEAQEACGTVTDPSGLPRGMAPGLGAAIRSYAVAGGAQGPQVEPDSEPGRYVKAASELGCMALKGPVSARQRAGALERHGFDERGFLSAGQEHRGSAGVSEQVADRLRSCVQSP